MAWRVIIRVGISYDEESKVRNGILKPAFEAMGLVNSDTGTWEASHVDPRSASLHFSELFNQLADIEVYSEKYPNAGLKHLWIYVDYNPD